MDDNDHSEIVSFITVWAVALASLCYCHTVGEHTTRWRPLAVLPVACIFLILPLNLTSICLGSPTAFFLVWLANFKLILFAYDQGPLSSNPPVPLLQFIALACLPIEKPRPQSKPSKGNTTTLNYASKLTLFVIGLLAIRYVHPNRTTLFLLYGLVIYTSLELILSIFAVTARALMQIDIEPQFDEPYLATSLQDFWGRRWNIMASKSLRLIIYDPVRTLFDPIAGRKWSRIPAALATFLASGFMHELILYYIGRMKPTGELTCFFLLHGASVSAEIGIKRILNGRFHLPVVLSRLLTLGFLLGSSLLLFFPPFKKSKADTKVCTEILAFIEFLKSQRLISPTTISCPFL